MILDDIIATKREEVTEKKKHFSADRLYEIAQSMDAPRDFAGSLRAEGLQIIAEIKKASPSAGVLCEDFDPKRFARAYAVNGAAAISVLTDARYFQGEDRHVADVRGTCSLPVLRKEFTIEDYQVYEARVLAADAVLLLTRVLSDDDLSYLLWLTAELGMAALVETHTGQEVERALSAGADVIGINNRDLATFETDICRTMDLRPLIPEGRVVVTESGIRCRDDLERLADCGVHAALIGGCLMSAPDAGAKLREFVGVRARPTP